MAKRNRENGRREGSPPPAPASFGSPAALRLATLVGVGAVLLLSVMTWSATRQLQTHVDEGLGRIQANLDSLTTKVEASARAAAQPRQQGPDPNHVYTVKTAGAPAEGPETAAVTIAEFSDFQ